MTIVDQVYSKLIPSTVVKRKIADIVSMAMRRITTYIRELHIDADPVLVGSVAKDTYIDNPDIDIFIRFAPKYNIDTLKRQILNIGKQLFATYELRYAQHPYISGYIEGYRLDLVPCYRINTASQKISAVDRTPFHTKFIIDHLTELQKKEVRVTKKFLKNLGIYGAEAKIEGFSGYLTELLILNYGSFINLLKSAITWKAHKVIAYETDLSEFDKRKLILKFKTPLIYIDPVDTNRNVASALSRKNYALFLLAARNFLNKPDDRFFFKQDREYSLSTILTRIKARGTSIYVAKMPNPHIVDDVLYPQIYRTEKVIIQALKEYEIINIHHSVTEHIYVIIEARRDALPAVKKHIGPPVWHKNAQIFLQKWTNRKEVLKGPYIEGDRLMVDIKTEQTSLKTALYQVLTQNNIGKHLSQGREEIQLFKLLDVVEEIPIHDLYTMFDYKFIWDNI